MLICSLRSHTMSRFKPVAREEINHAPLAPASGGRRSTVLSLFESIYQGIDVLGWRDVNETDGLNRLQRGRSSSSEQQLESGTGWLPSVWGRPGCPDGCLVQALSLYSMPLSLCPAHPTPATAVHIWPHVANHTVSWPQSWANVRFLNEDGNPSLP